MTIHASISGPRQDRGGSLPPGWWLRAYVVLPREPKSPWKEVVNYRPGDDDFTLNTEAAPWERFYWDAKHTPTPGSSWSVSLGDPVNFFIDSGADVTQLGTDAIRRLRLTQENTFETPINQGFFGAGGEDIPTRSLRAELWIPHRKPLLFGKFAYSAFATTLYAPIEAIEAVAAGSDAQGPIESLLGRDVTDYLLLYGGMRTKRPVNGIPSPLVFDIPPNWRKGTHFMWERTGSYPHDATTLAARIKAWNRSLKPLRRAPPT